MLAVGDDWRRDDRPKRSASSSLDGERKDDDDDALASS
jgi:hypothetical protein